MSRENIDKMMDEVQDHRLNRMKLLAIQDVINNNVISETTIETICNILDSTEIISDELVKKTHCYQIGHLK